MEPFITDQTQNRQTGHDVIVYSKLHNLFKLIGNDPILNLRNQLDSSWTHELNRVGFATVINRSTILFYAHFTKHKLSRRTQDLQNFKVIFQDDLLPDALSI